MEVTSSKAYRSVDMFVMFASLKSEWAFEQPHEPS